MRFVTYCQISIKNLFVSVAIYNTSYTKLPEGEIFCTIRNVQCTLQPESQNFLDQGLAIPNTL